MPNNKSKIIEVGAGNKLRIVARKSADWDQEVEIYRRPSGDRAWTLLRTLRNNQQTTISSGSEDYEFELRGFYHGWDRAGGEVPEQRGRKKSYRIKHTDDGTNVFTGYCDGWNGDRYPNPNYRVKCKRITANPE